MSVHPHKDLYHMINRISSDQFGWVQEATRQILGQPPSPMYHKFNVGKPTTHESDYHDILRSGHKSTLAHRIAAEPIQGSGLRTAALHALHVGITEHRKDRGFQLPPPTHLEKMPMEF